MNITITQTLRAIKLAFIIRPNSKNSYLRAIQICSSLWGGKHFPILPFYKKFSLQHRTESHLISETPIEFYRNALQNFNPDYIITDDGLDENLITLVKGHRKSIPIKEVEESIINGESQYGIAIDEILHKIKEKEFAFQRTDSLTVCCPKIAKSDLFVATLCGNVHPEYYEKIIAVEFPKKYIARPKITRDTLDKCIGGNILNYLSLGVYETDVFGSPLWTAAFAVYIMDPTNLKDLANLWNYRALGWNILGIPIGMIESPYYQSQLKIQQAEFSAHTRLSDRINVLFNQGINNEDAQRYVGQLSQIQVHPEKRIGYILHWWMPRFWAQGEFLRYDKAAAVIVKSTSKQTILSTEEHKVHIPLISPTFPKRYIRHISPRYINEVLLNFDETEGRYAQVLPDVPNHDLDFIIRGSGLSQWAFSKGVMNFLAQEQDEYLSFVIPDASEVFKKWFGVHKIDIRHSAPGKLANQLLKNIGGVYGTNFLANPGIPPVLALFENGKTVLKETLDAELSKQLAFFRDKDKSVLTAKLIDKSIIEFGARVQCTFCNQHSFYKLNDLIERVKCPICQNTFYTPSHNPKEIKWAYRGMGPFSRNNKADGLLCVLLTLRFFKISMHPSLITPLLNFELLKKNEVVNEVDMGVFFSKYASSSEPADLFLSECKVGIDFQDKEIIKMKQLGQLFPGAILTFATLKLNLSADEKERIKKIVNYFRKGISSRPTNPVLILTGNELLPKNTFTPFSNIEHRFKTHLQISDHIGHLCDVTCQQYLDLPSFGSIVEKRIDEKSKAWQEKTKQQETKNNEVNPG